MPTSIVDPSYRYTCTLLLALVAGVPSGCVGAIGDGAPAHDRRVGAASTNAGHVSLGLQLAGGIEVDHVTYAVSLGPTTVLSGTLMLSETDPAFRAVFVLAEAAGYVLTLEATPSSGPMCFGSATFDIMSGSTTPVTVALTCPNTSGSAGGADVTGFVNQCPTVSSLLGSRASAAVGEAITFDGVGSDPDGLPFPLAYMWSATSGTVVTPSAATTDVLCVSPGPSTITFRIFDGDPACTGITASLDVTCTASAADEDAGL